MSIKTEAQEIINNLPDDANWNDLVKELYRQKKLTLGLSDIEAVQESLTEADINAIMARLESSNSRPVDMRNTKTYNPGNAVTMGMIAGVVAILFSMVFPPIAWVSAAAALGAGVFGLSRKEEKAWIPVLLSIVALFPIIYMLQSH